MNSPEAVPSTDSTIAAPAEAMAGAFGWGEAFVLLPLHGFWILYKATPLAAENSSSALVASVPLGVAVFVGLAASLRPIRAAILSVEWLLHLTAAACMTIVLLYVALRDPLDPIVPITWPLCFWSISVAFVLLADLALGQRTRAARAEPASRMRWAQAVALAAAIWATLVWIGAGMTWAPYFLTVSIVFHAIMARASRARGAEAIRTGPRSHPRNAAATLAEALLAAAVILAASLRFLFTCPMSGTAEAKYFQFVALGASAWFVAGMALAMLGRRFRFAFLAHAAAVAVILFAGESAAWPVPFLLGYGATVLFLASMREGPLAYALSMTTATAAWGFWLLSFTLAGMVRVYEIGLGFATELTAILHVVAPALYLAWLALAGLSLWRSRRAAATAERDTGPIRVSTRAWTYAALWFVVLAPVACWVPATMWPPVWFHRAERVEVGPVAGICHAGSSGSDEEYAALDELGARLVRVDFHWGTIQPGPDAWNFEHFDAFVDAANRHGVDVLGLFAYDNNAVERSPAGSRRGPYIAPEDVPLFLEYVRRTVGRYKGRVRAWEIWNEPDITRFWTGTMDEFYELARRTAETVRQVDPKAQIVGTAMTSPLGVFVAEGIEGLHASGALDEVDHPSMHAYLTDPRGYYNDFLRVRNAAAKHGHPGSVWITELGDPDGGVYPWRASSDLLAEHVIKAFTIATSLEIEKLAWYCHRDSDLASQRKTPDDSEHFFGLVGPDGQWKPAAHAYRLFAKNCGNSVLRGDLVNVSGGIAARQLRAALYRRDDGQSSLILWFEPGLRPGAHARVAIDLGRLEAPAVMHDVTSDYTKPLLDRVVEVTEKPLFITYRAPSPETPAVLRAATSPADAAWLSSMIALVLWAAGPPRRDTSQSPQWAECSESHQRDSSLADQGISESAPA